MAFTVICTANHVNAKNLYKLYLIYVYKFLGLFFSCHITSKPALKSFSGKNSITCNSIRYGEEIKTRQLFVQSRINSFMYIIICTTLLDEHKNRGKLFSL